MENFSEYQQCTTEHVVDLKFVIPQLRSALDFGNNMGGIIQYRQCLAVFSELGNQGSPRNRSMDCGAGSLGSHYKVAICSMALGRVKHAAGNLRNSALLRLL